jgi:hypothetical protein
MVKPSTSRNDEELTAEIAETAEMIEMMLGRRRDGKRHSSSLPGSCLLPSISFLSAVSAISAVDSYP